MQHSPYDGYRQPTTRMHVQEISASSSVSERDLTDLVSPPAGLRYPSAPARAYSVQLAHPQNPQPYYSGSHHDERQQYSLPSPAMSSGSAPTVLQSFPSWDPTWRSGGVSEDGRAFTSHIPASHTAGWSPQTRHSGPPYGYEEQEGYAERHDLDGSPKAYLGGWEAEYSEEDHRRLTQGEYRMGVGFDTSHSDQHGNSKKVISDERKAQRLLALEKEFGAASGKKKGKQGEKKLEIEPEKLTFREARKKEKEERARINAELGVMKDGILVTQGPKLRASLRWLQGILALIAIGGGIGGAFLTHPDPSPPPSGKLPTWILYGFSILSFLITFWTFAIRRCFRRNGTQSSAPPASAGLVLPIFQQNTYSQLSGSHGGKQKSGGWFRPGPKKQKVGPGGMGQPMTVNLVVDPAALARLSGAPARYDDSGYDEEEQGGGSKRSRYASKRTDGGAEDEEETTFEGDEDDDFAIPDSSKQRRKPGIMSVLDPMEAMRLQDMWKAARRMTRRQVVQDMVVAVVWLALSVWLVGFGERCPPGTGNGWCDLYNTALACGVLLCVAHSTSLTLGILDLRRSRSVPYVSRGY